MVKSLEKFDKRENINEDGIRVHKVKTLSASLASGAAVNASYCRNEIKMQSWV